MTNKPILSKAKQRELDKLIGQVCGQKKSPYFTLSKAQRLIRIIPSGLTDTRLQKHIVKLRDYKRYIDFTDRQRLIDGGYYAMSAYGLVPADMWLQSNLGQALNESIGEKSKRINLISILGKC